MRPPRPQAIAVLLAPLVCLGAPAPAGAQVAYAAVKSLDTLRQDLKTLAPLVGVEAAGEQADAFLKRLAGDGQPSGLDRQRSFGVYLNWPGRDTPLALSKLPWVGFVPVSDEKQFLALLRQLGCKLRSGKAGLHHLTVPAGPEVVLRFAHGYGYAAAADATLKGPLPEPASFLPPAGVTGSLIVNLRPDRLPPDFSEGLSGRVEAAFQPYLELLGAKKSSDEADAEYEQRQALVKQFREQVIPGLQALLLVGLAEQVRELTVTLDVAPQRHALGLDVALVPSRGKDLADLCAYLSRARSQFGPLTRGADLGGYVHFPGHAEGSKLDVTPEQIASALRLYVDTKHREAVLKAAQILLTTLAADGLDAGLVASQGGGKNDAAVLGLKVREGQQLYYLFRDGYRDLLSAETKKAFPVTWNHDRHARARIHRFQVPGDLEPYYFATRDDVFFAAAGKGGPKALKDALDRFGTEAAAPTPFLRAAAGRAVFSDPDNTTWTEVVRKVLAGAAADPVRAFLSLQGGEDLRLHLEMTPAFLKLLVMRAGGDGG